MEGGEEEDDKGVKRTSASANDATRERTAALSLKLASLIVVTTEWSRASLITPSSLEAANSLFTSPSSSAARSLCSKAHERSWSSCSSTLSLSLSLSPSSSLCALDACASRKRSSFSSN